MAMYLLESVDGEQGKVRLLLGVAQQVNVDQLADLKAWCDDVLDDVGKELGHIPTGRDELWAARAPTATQHARVSTRPSGARPDAAFPPYRDEALHALELFGGALVVEEGADFLDLLVRLLKEARVARDDLLVHLDGLFHDERAGLDALVKRLTADRRRALNVLRHSNGFTVRAGARAQKTSSVLHRARRATLSLSLSLSLRVAVLLTAELSVLGSLLSLSLSVALSASRSRAPVTRQKVTRPGDPTQAQLAGTVHCAQSTSRARRTSSKEQAGAEA